MIVHPDMAARVPAGSVAILTNEPYAGWARVAALFYPMPAVCPGIHPSAIIAEGALVDPSAEIGPLSVIEAGAEIGPGCRIGPCAVIGGGVIVGQDCRIGAHVSLSHALWEHASMSIPVHGSDRKALDSPPPRMAFYRSPSSGG